MEDAKLVPNVPVNPTQSTNINGKVLQFKEKVGSPSCLDVDPADVVDAAGHGQVSLECRSSE